VTGGSRQRPGAAATRAGRRPPGPAARGRQRRRSILGTHLGWREHARAYLLALVALVLVWCALWGSVAPVVVLLGIAAGSVALLLFPLPTLAFRLGIHPWRVLVLLGTFLVEMVAASAQVAWLAVRPRLPRPQILEVQLDTDSDLVQVGTALAVSLVPGSLIVEADPQRRTLLVHVLDGHDEDPAALAESVRAQERRIVAAFGAASDQSDQSGRSDRSGRAAPDAFKDVKRGGAGRTGGGRRG
jgi:multicomponent Na+:H+ antiporter subunit E